MRRPQVTWVVVLGLVLSLEALPAAQSRSTGADVAGVVRDQTQGVLADARVTARNLDTNVERSTAVDRQGRFTIPLLPPGSYELRFESPGFASRTRTVVLDLGSVVEIDVELAVAAIAAEAEVVAQNSVLDLRKTGVAALVTSTQIERLPIDVRNFMSFAAITSGVTFDQTPQQGATATSGLTFAGQRARSNNITVDGLDNNDSAAGGVLAAFSQEAVQEFQVLTNSFPAEFGNAGGGVVNIVTKSGTNTLRGSAFMFFRDTALNATGHFEQFDPAGNPIDLPKAPYSQKQFGALIGGPIKRDRTFFLGSYERLDIAATNLVTIDDRNTVRHPFFGTPLGTPAQILRNAGFPVETGSVGYAHTIDQFLAKADHNFSPTQKLTVRFHADDVLDENAEPFGGITARSRGASLDSQDMSVAGSHTSVLSSRWLNELYVQAAYRNQAIRALDPTCVGICDEADEGGPTLEVIGVASVGRQRFTPQKPQGDDLSGLELGELLRRQSRVQSRCRSDHPGQSRQRLGAAAALRREVRLQRATRDPGCTSRADHIGSGACVGTAGGLRPGLRQRFRTARRRRLFALRAGRVEAALASHAPVRRAVSVSTLVRSSPADQRLPGDVFIPYRRERHRAEGRRRLGRDW
jgi:hypothetical protein